MNIKEIATIVIGTVSITLSILGWMELRFSTKQEAEFRHIETQMGINDIRLRSFEERGIDNLDETEKRIYEALKDTQANLAERRAK
jgi:hypothetical protein